MESALFNEWVADFVDEAEEKTKEKTKLEVAREMILDGESIDRIMKWTKLPLTAIRQLQNNI